MKTFILCLLAISTRAAMLPVGQPIESAANQRTYAYKKTPQGELKVNVFLPEGWQAGQKRPAILMFFGGGWTNGSPAQFLTKAQYLASRGMVALTPDYRVKTRQQTTPHESCEDAKSAIRWARMNASALGIDPNRIVASGGSAGATCAALTALSDSFEAADEDASVSSRPNALVLYNPALAPAGVAEAGGATSAQAEVMTAWKVAKNEPPMIFFFGANDKLLAGSEEVAKQLVKAGNRAEVYTAPGVGHGFFNDTKATKNGVAGWHEAVLYQTDLFLESIGYLTGKPTIQPNAEKKLSRLN